MLNIYRKVYYMIAASAVLVVFNSCTCYAETTFKKITIKCSGDFEKATWDIHEGEPNTRLILETNGIQEKGRTKLVDFNEYWNEVDHEIKSSSYKSIYSTYKVNILATCTSLSKFQAFVNMWPPNKTLSCKKGEGISIIMLAPNDPDPNKYQYKATLTMISGDKKKEAITNDIFVNSNETTGEKEAFLTKSSCQETDYDKCDLYSIL